MLSASNRIIVNFRNTRALAVPRYCPVMRPDRRRDPFRQPSVDQTEAETGVNKIEHLHLNCVTRILRSIIVRSKQGPSQKLSWVNRHACCPVALFLSITGDIIQGIS
jgi:hypothetical protein